MLVMTEALCQWVGGTIKVLHMVKVTLAQSGTLAWS